MNWRRFDTLFVRLSLLMWFTLVASHFAAFTLATSGAAPGGPPMGAQPPTPPRDGPPGRPPPTMSSTERPPLPPMPSLPPPMPAQALWLDYGLRVLVIALGAALGARWLSAPMRRLSGAADRLSQGLARGQPPQPLQERRGTFEVREAARIFNSMALRLQEQFDARGLHMAAVSHDLRTPLARLRLRLDELPGELADAAASDIHEMNELIDTTLAVLREQRDGSELRVIEMRSLLEAVADDLALGGHEVALAASPETRALGRPAALRRVVGNLVNNALRYGGSARLALASSAAGVQITVDDDGPGIPPEQLEQALQPWVRLATSHARSGHGLGLAIARELAERDGGTLTLANREGGGLRACLLLPAAPNVSAPTNAA